jgi:hypothetical protein
VNEGKQLAHSGKGSEPRRKDTCSKVKNMRYELCEDSCRKQKLDMDRSHGLEIIREYTSTKTIIKHLTLTR